MKGKAALQRLVRERAGNRCEYCRVPDNTLLLFSIDHIKARKHGGTDEPGNLAYACINCNLHKGTDLAGIDPTTMMVVKLHNPRTDPWEESFQMVAGQIVGLNPWGRATVELLKLNASTVLALRRMLISRDLW